MTGATSDQIDSNDTHPDQQQRNEKDVVIPFGSGQPLHSLGSPLLPPLNPGGTGVGILPHFSTRYTTLRARTAPGDEGSPTTA